VKEEFIRKFRTDIHVMFNWPLFELEDWPIDIMVLENNINIHDWYMPWYIDLGGQEANYNSKNAIPLSINDVLHSEYIMNKRNNRVSEIKAIFNGLEQPICFDIPVYSLNKGKYLVLDGNHRIIALIKKNIKYILRAYIIHGPIDENIIADLVHWRDAI
jgi:hypothetical protein